MRGLFRDNRRTSQGRTLQCAWPECFKGDIRFVRSKWRSICNRRRVVGHGGRNFVSKQCGRFRSSPRLVGSRRADRFVGDRTGVLRRRDRVGPSTPSTEQSMADIRISERCRRSLCWAEHLVSGHRSGRRLVKSPHVVLCADRVAFYRRICVVDGIPGRYGSLGRPEFSAVADSRSGRELMNARAAAILESRPSPAVRTKGLAPGARDVNSPALPLDGIPHSEATAPYMSSSCAV